MNSIASEALNSLKDLISYIYPLGQKVVFVYDQDDLAAAKGQFGDGVIGLVYMGMQSIEPKGRSVDIVVDIYVIGPNSSDSHVQGHGVPITHTLDTLRSQILGSTLNNIGGQRQWRFVAESPAFIDEAQGSMTYVQRWKTVQTLGCS